MLTYDKVTSDIINKLGSIQDNIKPNEDGCIELIRVGGTNENPIYGYTMLDGKFVIIEQ